MATLAQPAEAAPVAEPQSDEGPHPSPTFSGFVDVAYHVDFSNQDVDREQLPPFGQYTPPGHTFVLHAAHLKLAHSFSDAVRGVIALDAGYDASRTSAYPFNGSWVDVQEAFVDYKLGRFTFTGGKFAAYMGIEMMEGPLNPTITRSYSFNLSEPNTHTGLRAHYTDDVFDIGLGVVNGWDTLLDNNRMKTVIFKFGVTHGDAFEWNLNGTFGSETEDVDDEHRLALDLDATWTLTQAFELRFQLNHGMDGIGSGDIVRWYSVGVEPVYTSERFEFGGRLEWFYDRDGARTEWGEVQLVNLTLAPAVILAQNLRARLELRGDLATEQVFGKPGDPSQLRISVAVGADYQF